VLDLPLEPVIDKTQLVGGCVRMPLRIDVALLLREVESLPRQMWGTRGGRVGVHNPAEAIFLRGHAPAEGERPIEERPALALLPYARTIIETLIPAAPLRCLLARLPPGATIAPHVDRAPYFAKTIRVHVPVETHDRAWMIAGDLSYVMAAGEVWALNNCGPHAVWNDHTTRSRTHLICDFLPTPALLALLLRGERTLGSKRPEVSAHVAAAGSAQATG